MEAFPTAPASAPFNAVLDPGTFEMKRYEVAEVFDAPRCGGSDVGAVGGQASGDLCGAGGAAD